MFGGQQKKQQKGKPKAAGVPGRNAGKSRKDAEVEDRKSKQDLLAALTRQAEENSRILERERVRLGLPPPPGPQHLSRFANQPGQQGQQQQLQPGRAANANQRKARNHVFLGQDKKKVFDPSQVPGLGGNTGFPSPSAPSVAAFNDTFPESPSFLMPGMMFNLPGTMPAAGGMDAPQLTAQPPQHQQLSPRMGHVPLQAWGAPGTMAGPGGMMRLGSPAGLRPTPQPDSGGALSFLAGFAPGPGGPYHGSPGGPVRSPQAMGMGPPPPHPNPVVQARLEAEARKEAYRRDLEEQIRAKKQAKEGEAARQRAQDAAWEGRGQAQAQMHMQAPQWDGRAQQNGGTGGYGPAHEEHVPLGGPPGPFGTMGAPPGMGMQHPGSGRPAMQMHTHAHAQMGGPHGGGPHGGGGGALTILLPPEAPAPAPPGMQMQMGGPPGGGSQGGGHAAPSPNGGIPPVTPGNRRFMAAMSDLIAGPSSEQRQAADDARRKLQLDLEMQIREKKERQARERAEQERDRMREEADLRAYHDRLAAQKEEGMRARAAAAAPEGRGAPPPPLAMQQLHAMRAQEMQAAGGGQMQQQMGMPPGRGPPPPPAAPDSGRRRRGNGGRIIDASWLDAIQAPALPSPQQQLTQDLSPQGPPASNGARGGGARRGPPGMQMGAIPEGGALSKESSQQQFVSGLTPRDAAAYQSPPQRRSQYGGGTRASMDGGGGAASVGTGVTGALHQLQQEQARMREEVARQAVAMEKLAGEAQRALNGRDQAWDELRRVKAMLSQGGSPGQPGLPHVRASIDSNYGELQRYPGGGGALTRTSLSTPTGPLVVNTHLVPKSINAIPEMLPQPLVSEILERGHTDPGPGMYNNRHGSNPGIDDFPMEELDAIIRGEASGALRRNSGIPLPPGMGGGRHQHLAQRAAQAAMLGVGPFDPHGRGAGSHHHHHQHAGGQSRYSSFYNLEGEPSAASFMPPSSVHSGAYMGHLALPNRGLTLQVVKPSSPAILRGDHLPSPVKGQRTREASNLSMDPATKGRRGASNPHDRQVFKVVRGASNSGAATLHAPPMHGGGRGGAAALASAATVPAAARRGAGAHTENLQKLAQRRGGAPARPGERLMRTGQMAPGPGAASDLGGASTDELTAALMPSDPHQKRPQVLVSRQALIEESFDDDMLGRAGHTDQGVHSNTNVGQQRQQQAARAKRAEGQVPGGSGLLPPIPTSTPASRRTSVLLAGANEGLPPVEAVPVARTHSVAGVITGVEAALAGMPIRRPVRAGRKNMASRAGASPEAAGDAIPEDIRPGPDAM